MRSQISNQKSFSKDEDFMRSIYNKVSALRQNLESYQNNSPAVKKGFDQVRHSQTKSHITMTKMEAFNLHPKLNLVTLNDQSKINRQSYLLKIRFQHKNLQPFSKTTIGFSSTHRQNHKQPQTPRITSKQRSLSSFNLTGNLEPNKTKDYSKFSAKSQLLRRRHFSSKELPTQEFAQKKQKKLPVKIGNNQVQKGRTQNKMSRISSFLRKYDNGTDKNVRLQKETKRNKEMTENEEATQHQKKNEESIQIVDQDENFGNFHGIESLKQERRGLEERQTFKPIGSANGLRRSANKNQYTINSQHESNLVAREINQIRQKPQSGEETSNQDRQSAIKKNYLEKGNRFRQMLYKKLLKQDAAKPQEMIYVREYDQWVPSKLIQNHRQELQTYMKMLLGQKKIHKNHNQLNLQNLDLLYY